MDLSQHSRIRMIRALALPAHCVTLLLIVSFTLLLWLAVASGLFGLPIAIIVISWFFKYAFVLLDRVAEGDPEPPVLSYELIHPLSEQRPLGTAALLYLLYLSTQWIESSIGPPPAVAARALLLACVPAIIAVQGTSGRFIAALNPLAWFALIVRLKLDYALILIVVGVFVVLAVNIGIKPVLIPPFTIAVPFGQIVQVALLAYGWLALHSFIGAVLFERRKQIGFEPSRSPERIAEREQRERDKDLDLVVDRIFAEWRGGAHGNAWRTVEAHLERSDDRVATLRELFERIARWPDPRLGNLLAHELLPALLAARRTGEALTIVRERVQKDAAFRPQRAAETIKLAELARDAGHRSLALQLLSDFGHRFPGDPAQPVAVRLETELSR